MWQDVTAFLRRGTIIGASLGLLTCGLARGGDADNQKMIEELKTRMEAMAHQNEQLRQEIEAKHQQTKPAAEINDDQEVPSEEASPSQGDDQVKKLISDYLKDDTATKKAAEDARKKSPRRSLLNAFAPKN